MIYYPLSLLRMTGIRDVMNIITPDTIENFKRSLNDGSQFGVNLNYAIQPGPGGLAQILLVGESFIRLWSSPSVVR